MAMLRPLGTQGGNRRVAGDFPKADLTLTRSDVEAGRFGFG